MMRTAISIAVVIVVAAGIALYVYPQANAASHVETTPALQTPLNHIHALGRLEPRGRLLRIHAPSGNEGACIEKLLVEEGQDVEEGEVLAVLDNHQRRKAAAIEAEAQVRTAEAKLADIQAGAKQGEIAAQRAMVKLTESQKLYSQRQLDRARQLRDSNALSNEEFENTEWAFNRVNLEHQQQLERLASVMEVRATDVQVAEQEIAVARAAVVSAQANLAVTEIRAPITGRILALHCRTGERLSENGFAQIGNVQQMQAVAEVYEADLQRVKVGCRATVLVESTGETLEGVVVELGNLVARKVVLTNDPVSDTDARVVEVRVQLSQAASQKVERLSNARVQVHIELPPRS